MYNEDRIESGIFNDVDPLRAGDFYRFNCRTAIDRYLSEYVLHEFVKKDIQFKIPVLDELVRKLHLVDGINQMQDLYTHFLLDSKVHYSESEFVKGLSAILPEIPENTLIAQCFLMDTAMYLLYDNRKDNRFDKELYICEPYLLKKFYEVKDYFGRPDEETNPCDIVINENRKGRLMGFRLKTNEGLNRYGEAEDIEDRYPEDYEWEIFDEGVKKLSTGYRPGEKNRLGYFVPEPVVSTLKYKYLLRSPRYGDDYPSAELNYSEMLGWIADIVFIDFINERTYGKKCKARVLLNSMEDVRPDYSDEENVPHLYDSEKSHVIFTTESGKKITVDLFGLQEIHKISRIG